MDKGVSIIADPKGDGYRFAQKVYSYISRKKSRDFGIELNNIERTEFKDGEYKLKIEHNIRRRNCFYIHDPNLEPRLWMSDLAFVLDAMKSSSPEEINVVFPYMRFARQDIKDSSRVCVSAKAVAKLVSSYADRGMTIDLHSPQIMGFFDIPFDNLQSHPVVIDHLQKRRPDLLENLVVVSPDAGGGKRVEAFHGQLTREGVHSDMAICYKRRKKENDVAEVRIMGDVKDKVCLVIDDIIDTGGTLIKTGGVLKKRGAISVYAYGTHGLFTKGVDGFRSLDGVMISDTVRCVGGDNFECISMVDLFGEAVYRTIMGESLSSLFE